MRNSITRPSRWLAVALVAAQLSTAAPARAVSVGGSGPEVNGLVRLARFAACAGGVFYGFSAGGATAIDQALLFCAQLLSLEDS